GVVGLVEAAVEPVALVGGEGGEAERAALVVGVPAEFDAGLEEVVGVGLPRRARHEREVADALVAVVDEGVGVEGLLREALVELEPEDVLVLALAEAEERAGLLAEVEAE